MGRTEPACPAVIKAAEPLAVEPARNLGKAAPPAAAQEVGRRATNCPTRPLVLLEFRAVPKRSLDPEREVKPVQAKVLSTKRWSPSMAKFSPNGK